MWDARIDGRALKFHLSGINNQNFIMRDEETGSWWQQVTGEAIQGPLKGQRLRPMHHDELTFGLWQRENPNGRVLRPDEKLLQAGQYPADWETGVQRLPVTTSAQQDAALAPRALIVGLNHNGQAKAYPMELLQKQSPLQDTLGGSAVLLVLGDDKQSVRAFERSVDGQATEFYAKPNVTPLQLVDSATGSAWDFAGRATDGPQKGRELKKIAVLNDYWFDWKAYNPTTTVYQLR